MSQTRMAVRRLLVGSDGSAPGLHAFAVGEQLAALQGAMLAQVMVSRPELSGARPVTVPQARGTSVLIRRIGVPGVEIARCAEQWHADVVILGRSTAGPAQTTAMVLRRCTCPVLIVLETQRRFDRILFALDGTDRGLRILERGGDFGLALGAAREAVCVLPLHAPPPPLAASATRDRRLLVQQAMERRPELGGRGALAFRRGDAVTEVLSHLRETGADVLVLGLRQGGPGSDPGSGHVARDLLRVVPTAILTVPI